MSTGLEGWIEIFHGGPQRDSEGIVRDGDYLVDQAVETFNLHEHRPPVVVGHPKHDSPAWGWVKALRTKIKNGIKVLEAKFDKLAPEFVQAVEQGRYKERSAAFYQGGMLRHVGFLGGMPPAVKGLAPIDFAQELAFYHYEDCYLFSWETEQDEIDFYNLAQYV